MFDDDSSFLSLLQSRFSRFLSISWVRVSILVFTVCSGVVAIAYGGIALISSSKGQQKVCTIQAPPEYYQAQELRGCQAGSASDSSIKNNKSDDQIVIDISGAVHEPGVYELPQGSRISQAVEAAGGVIENEANTIFISKELNLSKIIIDGEKIYIPFLRELKYCVADTTESSNYNDDFNKSEVANNGDKSIEKSSANTISINTATKTRLIELTGIGEKRAESIITNRPYSDLRELVEKKVISETLFGEIESQISL